MNSLNLKRFKVLLVGTKIPENIGGVTRLLDIYAGGDAALIAPKCEWREGVAQWMATGPSIDRLNSLKLEAFAEKLSGKVALVQFGKGSGMRRFLNCATT